MRSLLFILLFASAPVRAQEKSAAAADELFARTVRPLLEVKCWGCHGGAPQIRGGLDLRERATLLRGGDSGPALVPGDAARSLIYRSVLRSGDLVMPPKNEARL